MFFAKIQGKSLLKFVFSLYCKQTTCHLGKLVGRLYMNLRLSIHFKVQSAVEFF
jgi:hypothetical protein